MHTKTRIATRNVQNMAEADKTNKENENTN